MAEPAKQPKQQPVVSRITEPVRPELMAPHSVEAEEAVIGSLLIGPDAIPVVQDLLRSDDFFIVRNGWIFDAILSIWRRGGDVDYVTVVEELRQQNRLNEIGGPAYLTHLINSTPSSMYVETYAKVIQRASDRRKLLQLAGDIAAAAYQGDVDLSIQYTDLVQKLTASRPRCLNQGLMLAHEVSDRFWAIQSREAAQNKVFPLPWRGATNNGLPYLTSGKMMVWGGDTGTGKTAGCETMAEHWARLGMRGFYIHTEMTQNDMVLRRYSRISKVPYMRLEVPWRLTDEEREARAAAEAEIGAWKGKLDFFRATLPTPERVLAAMHRAVQVFRCDFIVLDHFTSLLFDSANGKKTDAALRYEFVTRLVSFAEDHDILLLVATQMKTVFGEGRRAYGTSALNDQSVLFFDVNRKKLKGELKYRADGEIHRLGAGSFDPRVDLYIAKARFGTSATIPLFADMRRFLWRDRDEIQVISEG